MAGTCRAIFLAESLLTTGAGVFALLSPLKFLGDILPPHLTSIVDGPGGTQEALAFAGQIYGLVVVLLGVAELLLFMVKGQVHSKRSLLLAMLLADFIHLYVFGRAWFRDPSSGVLLQPAAAIKWMSSWQGTRNWVAFHTNITLIAALAGVRLTYLVTAKDKPAGPAKRKQL